MSRWPRHAVCARHQMAAEHVLHMQKALDQMNLQIHRVLSDITGISGLRILDAILMEVLKPLAIGYVGFPAGNILYVLRIDEAHLHPAGLEDLIHGNPVHTR